MCGIVGARTDWLVARGIDPARALADALAALRWRGPDGEGQAVAGPWRLGCARLAITGQRSRQPVALRGGRFVGALNGTIADARDLWPRLRPRAGGRTPPPNDAWLPLLAVVAGDADALATLRGHHAYAVADAATGELVLGQDRFGEKPLWCVVERRAAGERLVAIASTPAALRAFGLMPPWPPARQAEWFRRGWQHDAPVDLGDGLALLAVPQRGVPLATAERDFGWCGPWRAPEASTPAAAPGQTGRSEPKASDLRAALVASVGRSSDATVPVALGLSGGVDSSCLALALRELGRATPAYQLRAAGDDGRERTAAAAVAAACRLPLRPVDVGPDALLALPRLTACAGLPLGDPSILAVHALCRAAADDGVRVLLGGEGADELFLGYRRYRALARHVPLPWLRLFAPRLANGYAARWLRAAVAADPAATLLAVTPPAFADLVLADAPDAAADRETIPARAVVGDRVLAAQAADLTGYLRLDLLPKVDVAGMAAGLETRCPFLDRDVVDLALAAGRRGLGKTLLRAAFPDLPPAVTKLPKRGFALPLDRWFRGDLPWLDLLAEPRTRQRPHLRAGGIARAVDLHRAGRADLGHGLYLLVAAETYLRWRDGEIHASTAPGPANGA